jgi:peptide/nickel transport system permease protein
MALTGAGIILFMVAFCFIGPLIYRTDQVNSNPLAINLAPSSGHLLGTDENGFDTVGRLMVGGRSALEIGFAPLLWQRS